MQQISGDWKIRRRFMFFISLFCAWTVYYVLTRHLDTRTSETAIEMAFLCLTGIVSSYVFGASWENIHRLKNQQYSPAAAKLAAKNEPKGSD